jgi:hypothetical protein
MYARMTNNEIQKVRGYLATLQTMLSRRFDASDDESLLEFRRVCWAALLLVEDVDFQDQIDLLVRFAKEFFRGGEDLKDKMNAVLGACERRLEAVEGGYGKRWRDLRAA